ncbi:MAG: 4Fe-4S binding protein [Verrucomicrobia bacterium]|nr:4Fe-4S binding protein [Verrucomicrobiota bacterium]
MSVSLAPAKASRLPLRTSGRNWLLRLSFLLSPAAILAASRFPPPDFEGGHKLPETTTPAARGLVLEYLDVALLLGCLALATWLAYRPRSRRGLAWLSLFSLGYFGFYRKGCICAIGSIQNVALGFADRSYAIPLTVLLFFLAPLVVALFFGRTFCAAVCPQGAIQDLVLVKPLKVPAWLEHGLGVIPFLFLGTGAIFAATGSAFLICRFDPFVPIFRLSGSLSLLTLGAAFLLVGMFVGRPYCRFLCPYGAMLRVASLLAKWRVRVTPTLCTQCRLCEHECPFGAMRTPTPSGRAPEAPAVERKRLAGLVVLLPFLIAGGALAGWRLAPAAAQLHPTVELAEFHLANQKSPTVYPPMTPEALKLERAAEDPAALLAAAQKVREKMTLASWLVGAWAGLVIGLKLIALSMRVTRTDFEPDRGACVACARCFLSCPAERQRRGLPVDPLPAAMPATASKS